MADHWPGHVRRVGFCVLLVVALVSVGGLVVHADDDPQPVPAAYYGEVELNDEPAEPGVVIEAELDGDVVGSIEVTEAGEYGSPAIAEPKLQVNGTSDDEGEPVTFFVDGPDFDRTDVQSTDPDEVLWESGDLMQVNLSANVEFEEQLEAVELTLDDDKLEEGETTTATIIATFDDGSEADVTEAATIESLDPDVATVSNGEVTAEDPGNATIEAEYTEDDSTESDTAELTVERVGPPPLPGIEQPPQDLNGDGLYEDIDGDGEFNIFDVQALFNGLYSDVVQDHPQFFNFNEDEDPEEVTIFDVQGLFNRLAAW